MDIEEKEFLRSFDLDLLVDNINYFMKHTDDVEWIGEAGHFAYPAYPAGMRLLELIDYMGGFDKDYDRHIKEIFMADLNPSDLSFQEIRSYLTFIYRSEKFSDGFISEHMKNLVLLKLCLRLDDLVRHCMWRERPRTYSLHYLKSLRENVEVDLDNCQWILRHPLDQNEKIWFSVIFKESGYLKTYKIECLDDQTEYLFDRESIIRNLSPFSHMVGAQYQLLGQLLKKVVEHNGDQFIRDFVKDNCEKGIQRHYRVNTGLVFKVDKKNMTAYRYNESNNEWNLDYSLFVDFEQGEILQYEEIIFENYYKVEKKGPRILIGRHPDCDIVLNEPFASKQHAVVFFENGHWYIQDLDSKNGVLVNDQPVKKHQLKINDTIKIGLQKIYFYGRYLDYENQMISKEIYLKK